MSFQRFFLLGMVLALAVWGCATATVPVAPPRPEIKSYFYIGMVELDLKSLPDPASSDAAKVSLNERVEMLERGPAGWMLVRTADGRQGWANEKFLKIDPVTDLYVRRWGLRLRATPDNRGKTVARLRANDQVKLLDLNPHGWAQVVVQRTQSTGWLELNNLSVDQVVVRVRKRRPATKEGAKEAASEEAAPEEAEAAPAKPGLLGPSPAEAAPPPEKKMPTQRKAKPGMFDPF